MNGTLIEVIDRLDELDDSDPFIPLVIYAEGGPDAPPGARALVCGGDEKGSLVCPEDSSLSEVLMVRLAAEAIAVWTSWRDGRVPGPKDKFASVMYYARNDAYLPAEGGT